MDKVNNMIHIAGTAKPPSTSQASTSAYKVEEYYTFTEYSYYDLDPNATKLRCPVPSKFS